MSANALEEAELTNQISEQEPPPETSEPTPPPETETTALVSTEPDVIDGEVTAVLEPEPTQDHTPQKQKPYWLLIPFTILCCLLFLAASYLLPLLTPSATILIFPVERTISTTTAIQVHGRPLPTLTLSQSQTVPATGKMHQTATRAQGTIIFYNGLFTSQTIAAGTVLTGADGVKVVTDQLAIIPAANPPYIGQVTISAHAIAPGASGNIPAWDINHVCCVTGVKAVNIRAFTGGAAAKDFIVVTKADIDAVEGTIKTILLKSEQAALEAQITAEEALTTPLCSEEVTADHRIGEEAKDITVTVSETCSSIAYVAHDVYQDATQLLTTDATRKLGTTYSLIGAIQVHIIHAAITKSRQGQATILVQITGTWVYQITPDMQQHLIKLIAGKTQQQALALLLTSPGIQGAQISMKGGNRTLPTNPGSITMIIVYWRS